MYNKEMIWQIENIISFAEIKKLLCPYNSMNSHKKKI